MATALTGVVLGGAAMYAAYKMVNPHGHHHMLRDSPYTNIHHSDGDDDYPNVYDDRRAMNSWLRTDMGSSSMPPAVPRRTSKENHFVPGSSRHEQFNQGYHESWNRKKIDNDFYTDHYLD